MDRIDRAVLRWGLLVLAANKVAFVIHQLLHPR
jgi:hypothetical protein